MLNIVFICEGNICRSIMAECVMKHLLSLEPSLKDVQVISRATSSETTGSYIYPPAKAELIRNGIPVIEHRAQVISQDEADKAELIIGMDFYNRRKLFGCVRGNKEKFRLLMSFTDDAREIDDPFYSRNFHKAYEDIYKGCTSFLEWLKKSSKR